MSITITGLLNNAIIASIFASPTGMESHTFNANSTASSGAAQSMLPPAKTRKNKAPTLRDSDWEPYRDRITKLYTNKTPLKQVKEMMETEFGFIAE